MTREEVRDKLLQNLTYSGATDPVHFPWIAEFRDRRVRRETI